MCVCVCVCLVAQSHPTHCDPMDYSPSGSSVHGDSPGKNTGVGCHTLLQGIFPTQGLNPGLLHCRWILYCLSPQGKYWSASYHFGFTFSRISHKRHHTVDSLLDPVSFVWHNVCVIHPPVIQSFLLLWRVLLYVCTTVCLSSHSVKEKLGCFQFGAIIKELLSMNRFLHTSFNYVE